MLLIGLTRVTHVLKSLSSGRTMIYKIIEQCISRTYEMLYAVCSVKVFG